MTSKMVGHQECRRIKSTGRLCSGVEAKVVDIISGALLSIYKQGELCIRSPSVMLGNYITILSTYICIIYLFIFYILSIKMERQGSTSQH